MFWPLRLIFGIEDQNWPLFDTGLGHKEQPVVEHQGGLDFNLFYCLVLVEEM